ncbi:MAG TPA: HAMP domain-containing sensor histidine kinase [Bosea sp. (in: a-proteobacteria)]|jgi:signal transduction histidine kinase|uniref:sensor histidine kinase n=1 Tax=Bosea sp. (in: a-proteobacteria) TaxID=1871050 RepID=UPI002E1230E0|nr:HAMP domain-containing sensor histidine kinase [Bosea sp. (in: a-proteobacteria)]
MTRMRRFLHLPRTLRSRLFLILFAGLAAAHILSFGLLFYERTISAKATMYTTLENDVATSIALLDRLPPQERPQWLPMLDRRTYRYELGAGLPGVPELSPRAAEIAHTISVAAGRRFPVKVESIPGEREHLQAHVTLSDGTPVTIDIHPALMPLASWLPYMLAAQLALLVACTWLAVRLAIRPLLRFANAAETLDPGRKAVRLEETGPAEVAYAATAFNAMRDRIAHYLQERVQILAAISHDLQTPITRMKLRAEMADESPEKERLISDLSEIERLVREGVAYAKSAHGDIEKPTRIDIASFVESIAFDYQDTGKAVTVPRSLDATAVTRPHALRRILTNLIDNALKFAGDVEIEVGRAADGKLRISVLDRGPGIPEDQLVAVLQPFYRVEQSRNRDTGGTGLGLAIAQQLSVAIGGSLRLVNRPGGGLSAEVTLD